MNLPVPGKLPGDGNWYPLIINYNLKLSGMKYCIFLAIILVPSSLIAQIGNQERISGAVSRSGFSIGECHISSMTVKYALSTYMGEPIVGSNLKWTKGYPTDENCLSGESFEIFIKASVGYYTGNFLIEAGEGTIPKGDGQYGYNPLSGSPDWDELFIPFDYGSVRAFQSNRKYLSGEQVKKIWKSGFRVLGVVFIDREGKEVTLAKY